MDISHVYHDPIPSIESESASGADRTSNHYLVGVDLYASARPNWVAIMADAVRAKFH